MRRAFAQPMAFAVSGLWLGVVVTLTGVSDYGEIRSMATLQSFRLFAVFGAAVGLSAVAYFWLSRSRDLPRRPIHKGTLAGGALFGLGWALTGA